MNTIQTKNIAILVALIALMAATRSHHFDTLTHMPDASLAAFLLAGFYLPTLALPLLLGVAGCADYFAFNYAGVSDWCFSPAYWFLIPTYAVMWSAGRFYRVRHSQTLQSLALFGAIALVATSIAFVISSGSFYLFSGRFADMTALQYAGSVSQYYVPYLISAFMYLSVAVGIQIAAEHSSRRAAHG